MERGPCWTLRLAALALATAPMLHHALSPVRGGRFEPFSDLRSIESMFEGAPVAWLFCWFLPCVASRPAWRVEGWASGFTFTAYLGLLISLMVSRDSWHLAFSLAVGVAFVALLLVARIEIEVAAAWARICLAGVLLLACVMEFLRRPEPSAGLIGLAIGGVLMAAGELWALGSVPAEDPN